MLLRDNIYQSDRVRSPFLLGLIHPKIYIPYGLDADTLKYVLAHEQYHIPVSYTHLNRWDDIYRPGGPPWKTNDCAKAITAL